MRRSAAVLFPLFLGGGAEAVCLWMLQALADQYSVSLVTLNDVNLKRLDENYGTSLAQVGTRLVTPKQRGAQWLLRRTCGFTFRQHYLMRLFKRVGEEFDIAISAYNEMDLGRRGVQYVHLPLFSPRARAARGVAGHPSGHAWRLNAALAAMISGFSERRFLSNFTVVNSEWTRKLLATVYPELEAVVVYPPASAAPLAVQWNERENGFVLISRIVPEKRVLEAIELVGKVRERGHDVHLHLVGGIGDAVYGLKVRAMCAKRNWVSLEERLTRTRLTTLLAKHKYAVHTRKNEQYGIGVAETVLSGCIPFVPKEGGQAEIVEGNASLTFETLHEAVEKIDAVMRSEPAQRDLRGMLRQSRAVSSPERFMLEVKDIVNSILPAERG